MHINAVTVYIIMGVNTLLKGAVSSKEQRKFQTRSSRSESVGYKSSIRGMLVLLSSHRHAESLDIILD